MGRHAGRACKGRDAKSEETVKRKAQFVNGAKRLKEKFQNQEAIRPSKRPAQEASLQTEVRHCLAGHGVYMYLEVG